MNISALIKQHPVWAYFALTFAISWSGFILVVGPGGFPGKPEEFEALLPVVAWAMLAGPSIAGIFLTAFIYGKTGLRELLSQLVKWRVSAPWFLIAILPAPIVTAGLLFALSLNSPIFTTDNKTAILLTGIFAGLSTVFEEIGWTGFAVLGLRRHYSVLTTGLIVGVLWGAWHFLQILWVSDTYSGSVSPTLFFLLYILSSIAGLTAYRILLVWIYDRTGSLLMTTIMHASLTACNVFIFRPEATGESFLIYGWAMAAVFWIIIAAVAVAQKGELSQQPITI